MATYDLSDLVTGFDMVIGGYTENMFYDQMEDFLLTMMDQ